MIESENYAGSDNKLQGILYWRFNGNFRIVLALCFLCVGLEVTGTENVKCRILYL